jgi:steroid 5-alpha reductase family enzyme
MFFVDSIKFIITVFIMIRTTVLLIATLIAIPLASFYFGDSPSQFQIHALYVVIRIMLITSLVCFVVSELTTNYSQVDKLWSIMPIVYTWYFASVAEWNNRAVIMAILVTCWGVRLTYNFNRKGGYHRIPWKGVEDYRWSVLRQNPALKGRWRWAMFNLFFISLYQQSLILLFTLPALLASTGVHTGINFLDITAICLFVFFLVIESIADAQQYQFQREKHRRIAVAETLTEPYLNGFISNGLWRIVRHPNYAGEQAIWISFYLFSIAATGQWINWSMTGCVLLILLFIGSSNFSEEISAKKYPNYKQYQKKVPRFFPKLW